MFLAFGAIDVSEPELSNCASNACTFRPGVRTTESDPLRDSGEDADELGVVGVDMATIVLLLLSVRGEPNALLQGQTRDVRYTSTNTKS